MPTYNEYDCALGQHQPGHEDKRHVEENLRQKLILVVLPGIFVGRIAPEVTKVERRREESKGERSDAKRHVEPTIPGEALESLWLFRLSTLSSWPRWHCFSGIFLASTPPVQRNNFLLTDRRFAHRTRIPVAVHPLMYARPAEQMAAHADDGVLGRVQTDVALKYRIIFFLLSIVFEINFGFAAIITTTATGTGF